MPIEWLLPIDLQAFLVATTRYVNTESSLGDADTAGTRVWAIGVRRLEDDRPSCSLPSGASSSRATPKACGSAARRASGR